MDVNNFECETDSLTARKSAISIVVSDKVLDQLVLILTMAKS